MLDATSLPTRSGNLKNIIFEVKIAVAHIWETFGDIWLLFSLTSGHTAAICATITAQFALAFKISQEWSPPNRLNHLPGVTDVITILSQTKNN